MAIQMSCPQCGKIYLLIDRQAGLKVRCKQCNAVFTVPAPVEPAGRPTSAHLLPAPSAQAADRPVLAGENARLVTGLANQPTTAAPARSLVVLLLLGGIVVAMTLSAGAGGLAVWWLLRGDLPLDLSTTVLSQDPAATDEVERRSVAQPTAKGLEELKAATVFVKVVADPLATSGSGFVLKVEGETGYIVTNEHVINPRVPPGPRGRRGGPPPVPRNPAAPPEITLVFWSGTRQEQSYRAEVAAADPGLDLAILKVTGVANLPRPIDVQGLSRLVETLPVTVFGFPFGQNLGLGQGNPAITVSQGTISSVRRNNYDEVVAVQIDGALNPGNSGGPVLDAEGRLVGVAVATIPRASNIGLAIPATELARLLEGRVGEVRATTRGTRDDTVEVEVEVPLIDPLKRLESVTVYYLRSDLVQAPAGPNQESNLAKLASAQRLALRLDGQRAVGTILVQAEDKDKPFTFQTTYTNGIGQLVYTLPRTQPLHPPAADRATGPGRSQLPR
jgi:S1-C subfamily serine protease/phage FluMu protein Com